jgi:hypothetical protein
LVVTRSKWMLWLAGIVVLTAALVGLQAKYGSVGSETAKIMVPGPHGIEKPKILVPGPHGIETAKIMVPGPHGIEMA